MKDIQALIDKIQHAQAQSMSLPQEQLWALAEEYRECCAEVARQVETCFSFLKNHQFEKFKTYFKKHHATIRCAEKLNIHGRESWITITLFLGCEAPADLPLEKSAAIQKAWKTLVSRKRPLPEENLAEEIHDENLPVDAGAEPPVILEYPDEEETPPWMSAFSETPLPLPPAAVNPPHFFPAGEQTKKVPTPPPITPPSVTPPHVTPPPVSPPPITSRAVPVPPRLSKKSASDTLLSLRKTDSAPAGLPVRARKTEKPSQDKISSDFPQKTKTPFRVLIFVLFMMAGIGVFGVWYYFTAITGGESVLWTLWTNFGDSSPGVGEVLPPAAREAEKKNTETGQSSSRRSTDEILDTFLEKDGGDKETKKTAVRRASLPADAFESASAILEKLPSCAVYRNFETLELSDEISNVFRELWKYRQQVEMIPVTCLSGQKFVSQKGNQVWTLLPKKEKDRTAKGDMIVWLETGLHLSGTQTKTCALSFSELQIRISSENGEKIERRLSLIPSIQTPNFTELRADGQTVFQFPWNSPKFIQVLRNTAISLRAEYELSTEISSTSIKMGEIMKIQETGIEIFPAKIILEMSADAESGMERIFDVKYHFSKSPCEIRVEMTPQEPREIFLPKLEAAQREMSRRLLETLRKSLAETEKAEEYLREAQQLLENFAATDEKTLRDTQNRWLATDIPQESLKILEKIIQTFLHGNTLRRETVPLRIRMNIVSEENHPLPFLDTGG